MKVLILLITVLASALATQLLSADDIENLFRKHVRKELSKAEAQQFQDVLDILRSRDYSAIVSRDESFERMSIDCLVCWAALSTVFEAVENGQPDEEIENIVETLCYNLGIGGQSMCHGIAALNVPIITHIIRTTPEATARAFCGNVLQTDTDPNFCRVDDQRFEWTVDLPPPPATPIVPPATPAIDTKPLKIALITDAHIDPLYEAFGVAECSEINCCRKGQTPRTGTYKPKSETEKRVVEQSIVQKDGEVMLDISKASDLRQMRSSVESKHAAARTPEPAGYWGDYRNCDTPIWAFDDVIERIAETHKDVDLVYYVGDTIDHHIWETTYDLINDMNRHLIDKIRSSFGDDVLVIPNIGNHESQPTNQFAPSRVTGRYLNTTWLYDSLARKWDHYLPEGAKRTLRERGEFSVEVRPGLRVISLNTNVAYKYNWWLTYDPTDAKKHLDWLISELYEAERAGEKVHIVSHIPPGVQDLTLTWTREYNRIVNRFTKTIVAEFNGHTHGDQIRIFYNPEGEPINVAWGGGSASSYTFYNVNYKILDIDTATYEPKTIENYIYNLTEANLTPNRRPHWFQLYEMKHSFRLTDLSAASMNDLFHRMVTTDRDLLDLYGAFHSRLSDYRWPQCDINCRLSRVCNSVITVLWERQKCDEFIHLYHISNQ